jgi:hypothetical protein
LCCNTWASSHVLQNCTSGPPISKNRKEIKGRGQMATYLLLQTRPSPPGPASTTPASVSSSPWAGARRTVAARHRDEGRQGEGISLPSSLPPGRRLATSSSLSLASTVAVPPSPPSGRDRRRRSPSFARPPATIRPSLETRSSAVVLLFFPNHACKPGATAMAESSCRRRFCLRQSPPPSSFLCATEHTRSLRELAR